MELKRFLHHWLFSWRIHRSCVYPLQMDSNAKFDNFFVVGLHECLSHMCYRALPQSSHLAYCLLLNIFLLFVSSTAVALNQIQCWYYPKQRPRRRIIKLVTQILHAAATGPTSGHISLVITVAMIKIAHCSCRSAAHTHTHTITNVCNGHGEWAQKSTEYCGKTIKRR